MQCQADARAVLLVAFDVAAVGALASVTASEGLLACALGAGAARRASKTIAAFDWSLAAGPAAPLPLRSAAARTLAGNAMAGALPLFETIARRGLSGAADDALALPLSTLALAAGPAGGVRARRGDGDAMSALPSGSDRRDAPRRRHHRRRPGRPDPGAAAEGRLRRPRHPGARAAPASGADAAHKVGESTVEIGAHYFAEVLGLKAAPRDRRS